MVYRPPFPPRYGGKGYVFFGKAARGARPRRATPKKRSRWRGKRQRRTKIRNIDFIDKLKLFRACRKTFLGLANRLLKIEQLIFREQ